MRFAQPCDMEPGMWFRTHAAGEPQQWWGVEPVASRFAGKRRVRVLCSPGEPFVCDADKRFQVITWERKAARA